MGVEETVKRGEQQVCSAGRPPGFVEGHGVREQGRMAPGRAVAVAVG